MGHEFTQLLNYLRIVAVEKALLFFAPYVASLVEVRSVRLPPSSLHRRLLSRLGGVQGKVSGPSVLSTFQVPMMLAKNVSESHRDPNICVCTVQKRINREEATVRLTSRQENIKMVKTFSPTVVSFTR